MFVLPRAQVLACALFALATVSVAAAQQQPPESSSVAIDDAALEAAILQACAAQKADGALVDCRELVRQAARASACELPALAPRTTALPLPELHDLLRRSCRIVGHYYLCKECDDWHFSGASGFCVDDRGAIATCRHVLDPDDGMREAFLVAADLRGRVWPVQALLASAPGADLCVLRTAERDTVPLPWRPSVRAGERVYCLSNPDHQFGFFSEGLVARQFLLREAAPGAATPPLTAPPSPWLHVTCDFCKGSSGAPIVDGAGNVVGIAQSTTTVVYDDAAPMPDTQMVFKIAAPASAFVDLIRTGGKPSEAPPGR